MFSAAQKQQIAAGVEKLLLELNHPEMRTEKPQFRLRVEGSTAWSWAEIVPNWHFDINPPGINPHNERVAKEMKEK